MLELALFCRPNFFCILYVLGTVGVVDISRFASYGYDQRLEVFGPGGMLQVDNERPTSSTHFTNTGVSRYETIFRKTFDFRISVKSHSIKTT